MKHSLTIRDRGSQHVHRWLPVCSCARWSGVPLRDRGRAAAEYRAHVRAAERAEHQSTATVQRVKRSTKAGRGRRTRTGQAGPKPLTPHDQLPPELQ